MSGTKGVEHEDVAVGSEGLGDLGIILLLALVKADVLEHEDLARLEGLDGGSGLLAVGVVDEGHVQAGELGELGGDGLEGELGLEAGAVRAAEVAHEDDAGVVLDQVVDGRQGGLDAGGVANDAVLDRHVEVNADEDALAVDVDVADGLLGESHVQSFLGICARAPYPRTVKRARPRAFAVRPRPLLDAWSSCE